MVQSTKGTGSTGSPMAKELSLMPLTINTQEASKMDKSTAKAPTTIAMVIFIKEIGGTTRDTGPEYSILQQETGTRGPG